MSDPLPTPKRRFARWRGMLLSSLLLGFIVTNGLAAIAAWSMTHFEKPGIPWRDFSKLSHWEKVCRFARDFAAPRPPAVLIPGLWGRADCTTLHYPGADHLALETWRVSGQKGRPIILLFHGYAASKSSLDMPAHEFHSLGCETWLVDFHGSGGSAGYTTSVGYDEAEDVAATVQQALARRAEPAPLILYGSSMGAAAILCAVHRFHVEPDALILECPFDRLLTTVGNRCHMLGAPAFPAANLLVFWGGVENGFNGFAHNPVEYARDVKCPTLLMQGELDERVGLEHSKEIASALGEHCTFKVFPKADHLIRHSTPEWKAGVHDFLHATHLIPNEAPLK